MATSLVRMIPFKSYLQRKWKNGKGVSRDIVQYPSDSADEFLWRLSMADLVESGPFSSFPGIDRVLILLEGHPIKLRHKINNQAQVVINETALNLLSPYEFYGGWETEATISERGLDLNIMCKKEIYRSNIEVKFLEKENEDILSANDCYVFLNLSTNMTIKFHESKAQYVLKKYDSLIINEDCNLVAPKKVTVLGDEASYLKIVIERVR